MPRLPKVGLLCLLLAAPLAHAAQLKLVVEGLSGRLQKNVNATLSTIAEDEISNDGRFRVRAADAIRQGLRALGYFQPTIEFSFRPGSAFSRPQLIAQVTPGEPVRIAGVNVRIRGEAKDDPTYQALLASSLPPIGSVLDQGDYDSLKSALNSLALQRGYFDATMPVHQLGVIEDQHKAYWDIEFDSGPRYRFGAVQFSGSQIRTPYLQNLRPFKQGDYYNAGDLAKFSGNLSATNWFNSVVVAPDFKAVGADHRLPMQAVVTPRSRNMVDLGGGYATDVGPRLKLGWKRPWTNSYGHSLDTSLNLSVPEQTVDFSYKIPLLKNPLEQYYLVQGGFQRTDLNDTESDSTTLNLARYWDLSSGWQRGINLRWSLDHFTQGNTTETTMLLYPGVSVNRTRSRGGLMPTWGDTQRYSLEVSNMSWGSAVDFAVIQAQNVWIRTLAEKHRFVVRGNLGWIETNDFNKVPPSLRFFAGGDRSIRGYKYKSISPKDSEGKLTGASRLVTGSLEYQYNLSGKWWGGAFIDSGEAVNDITKSNFHTGTGVGLIWVSPVGPIRLNLAVPVGSEDKHDLQFYIGLGPEL
ncbi:autotransporter assembly complex protein TamA [Edwardsiella tarda]